MRKLPDGSKFVQAGKSVLLRATPSNKKNIGIATGDFKKLKKGERTLV
jgi:hypothetical protein